nr:hypothetical protein [uncultured Chryseobacterium sp.]
MKNLIILLTGLLVSLSCAQQKGSINTEIPYKEAKNYFVKNTYKANNITFKKILSQKEFDEIFGMATTMGKAGKPTDINFSKDYIIALIGTDTDANHHPEITINNLTKNGDSVKVLYSTSGWSIDPNPASYTVMPVKILIVSKKYDGNVSISLK